MRFPQVTLNAFFSLLFAFSLFAISPLSSQAQGKVMLSDANGADEVLVHFSMDVEDMIAFQGQIVWDTSVLHLKEMKPEVWPCCLGYNIIHNESSMLVSWDDQETTGKEFHEDEALLSFTFEVLKQEPTMVYFTEGDGATLTVIEAYDSNTEPIYPVIKPAIINGTTENVTVDLFRDISFDCEEDMTIGQRKVYLYHGDFPLVDYTNSDGKAEFTAIPGTYELTVPDLQINHSLCRGDQVILEVEAGTNAQERLVISPDFECPENRVSLFAPDYQSAWLMDGNIYYKNTGTVNSKNTRIELEVDSNMQLTSSEPPYDEQIGNTFIYNIGDVGVLSDGRIEFDVEHNGNIPIEDIPGFIYTVKIIPDTVCNTNLPEISQDTLIKDNSQYDPDYNGSDISWVTMNAQPAGMGPDKLISLTQSIFYRITYKNLGNEPIEYMTIYDTLPPSLDASSVKIINFDHTYYPNVLQDSILYLEFPDLSLPDSASAQSDEYMGTITFQVLQNEENEHRTTITNKAWVQFNNDQLFPTNEVTRISVIDPLTSVPEKVNDNITIFPNPFNNHLIIKQNSNSPLSLNLFNALGELVYSDNITGKQTEVQVPNMGAGLYFYTIFSDGKQISNGKLVRH